MEMDLNLHVTMGFALKMNKDAMELQTVEIPRMRRIATWSRLGMNILTAMFLLLWRIKQLSRTRLNELTSTVSPNGIGYVILHKL